MGADLHIHVVSDNLTERDFRIFFAGTGGSKWSPETEFWQKVESGEIKSPSPEFEREYARLRAIQLELQGERGEKWEKVYHKMATETPEIWIGEVSWLKAALFEDEEAFIPDPVDRISDLIGEDWPVLDDELIENILAALEIPNKTGYRINTPEKVWAFLEKHRGERVFQISW